MRSPPDLLDEEYRFEFGFRDIEELFEECDDVDLLSEIADQMDEEYELAGEAGNTDVNDYYQRRAAGLADALRGKIRLLTAAK